MRYVSKIIRFITVGIWQIQLENISRVKLIFIKYLRIFIIVFRGFNKDNCELWASALTYYSLLSMVPVAAVAFGIAKGFGIERILEQQLLANFSGQEEIIKYIIEYSYSFLNTTKGGLVAGIGIVLLIWIVIKALGNIENAFNHIWGIQQSRTLARKLSDYLSVLFISPILIIISGSINIFIAVHANTVINHFDTLHAINPFILLFMRVIPLILIWIFFSFLYIFIPNTKVNLRSAVIGGFVGGLMYIIVQWLYIKFQIGAVRYNAIYGSFAALPLFLVWLQLSWLIVFFGAEVSFAYQNVHLFDYGKFNYDASFSIKKLLAIRIVHMVVKNFSDRAQPFTASHITQKTGSPIRLVRQILHELTISSILNEVTIEQYKEKAYQPALNPDKITIQYVIAELEKRGEQNIPYTESKEIKAIQESLKQFSKVVHESKYNNKLKDI